MHTGKGQVVEIILEDGHCLLRVSGPPSLTPSPGQYLLAADGSDTILNPSKCSPLPAPLFYTDSTPQGFIVTAPTSRSWNPGMELTLRGPLGRGFSLPFTSRKVGLLAFDASPMRLKGLIQPALQQNADIVLVCASTPEYLPHDVEVQPLSALNDVVEWADYVACDTTRENLSQMRERFREIRQLMAGKARVEQGRNDVQVLVHTPVPCGGVAECGVCAVSLKLGWRLACKDGPVFDWSEIDPQVS